MVEGCQLKGGSVHVPLAPKESPRLGAFHCRACCLLGKERAARPCSGRAPGSPFSAPEKHTSPPAPPGKAWALELKAYIPLHSALSMVNFLPTLS